MTYTPRGGALEFFRYRGDAVVLHGPSGSGKSRSVIEKLYMIADTYPGCRLAFLRRYRKTITQSIMITFDRIVRKPGDGVKFSTVDQEYNFPNGSQIVVAGLDDPEKILSTEFDIIYVNECTEISEATWEVLSTRLRWGKLPYQQLVGDCNPSSSRHWIMRRHKAGSLDLIKVIHKDNGSMWDHDLKDWTVYGRAYMDKLEKFTGLQRERFLYGNWVAAEGIIYSEFNPDVHIIKPFKIPSHWDRFVTVDFGFTKPAAIQWWAKDPDGRLYMYRELYGTQRTVEDWAHDMYTLGHKEPIRAYVCDHDAEDRATLERHLGHDENSCYGGRESRFSEMRIRRVPTIGVDKATVTRTAGIQNVKSRLALAGDGKPRLFLFQGALACEPDKQLIDNKQPTCTEEEIDEYVWDTVREGRYGPSIKEVPRKDKDHGMDAMRYAVVFADGHGDVPVAVWGASVKKSYGSSSASDADIWESINKNIKGKKPALEGWGNGNRSKSNVWGS